MVGFYPLCYQSHRFMLAVSPKALLLKVEFMLDLCSLFNKIYARFMLATLLYAHYARNIRQGCHFRPNIDPPVTICVFQCHAGEIVFFFKRQMDASAKNVEKRWMMANIPISQARSAPAVHATAAQAASPTWKELTPGRARCVDL